MGNFAQLVRMVGKTESQCGKSQNLTKSHRSEIAMPRKCKVRALCECRMQHPVHAVHQRHLEPFLEQGHHVLPKRAHALLALPKLCIQCLAPRLVAFRRVSGAPAHPGSLRILLAPDRGNSLAPNPDCAAVGSTPRPRPSTSTLPPGCRRPRHLMRHPPRHPPRHLLIN